MNKEKMNQIIDEAYEKYLKHTIIGIELGFDAIKGYLDGCLVEYDGHYEHFTNPSFAYGFRTHKKEEFINKCKTDPEFSEKWGLKIEERELSLLERYELMKKLDNWVSVHYKEPKTMEYMDKLNVPTKLITITYNNETIEVYE